MKEKFNPANPDFEKVSDLPIEKRGEFVNVKNKKGKVEGFVKKEAMSAFKEAIDDAINMNNYRSLEEIIFNVNKMSAKDVLHDKALDDNTKYDYNKKRDNIENNRKNIEKFINFVERYNESLIKCKNEILSINSITEIKRIIDEINKNYEHLNSTEQLDDSEQYILEKLDDKKCEILDGAYKKWYSLCSTPSDFSVFFDLYVDAFKEGLTLMPPINSLQILDKWFDVCKDDKDVKKIMKVLISIRDSIHSLPGPVGYLHYNSEDIDNFITKKIIDSKNRK